MLKVFGLDPSMTATGWAVGSSDDARPVWGVHRSPSWGEEEGRHLCRFEDFLDETIERYRPTSIYYEESYLDPHSSLASQRSKLLLEAIINRTACRHSIDIRDINIGTWRAKFTGSKNAPPHFKSSETKREFWKSRAVTYCAKRGWFADDHNAAEALAIMCCGLCDLDPLYYHRQEPMFRDAQRTADEAGCFAEKPRGHAQSRRDAERVGA